MFLKGSRYAAIPTVVVRLPDGREVTAVRLRRIPRPDATSDYRVRSIDRLDLLAGRHLGDATRYWSIADADTELDAHELEQADRVIAIPEA